MSCVPNAPLVTVGIPTHNRPQGLARTLTMIRCQTHTNLEIIVSDNASPDPAVRQVVLDTVAQDPRVAYHLQQENRGASANFKFVLSMARGEYFLWAADDDAWEPNFVEKCLHALADHPTAIAATLEAQYFNDQEEPFPFIPEGTPFYDVINHSRLSRLLHIVRNNYGNLVYALFRKQALLEDGGRLPPFVLNEIPLLLWAGMKGPYVVLPEVGIYKQTTSETYAQARWEMTGGKLPPTSRLASWSDMASVFRYHAQAARDIASAINDTPLRPWERHVVKAQVSWTLWAHYAWMLLRWKPRKKHRAVHAH